VYVGSDDHHLYAFSTTDGSNRWNVPVDSTYGGLSSAPTVEGDSVYASSASMLYAFNANDGSVRWSVPTFASGASSAPSVSNGRVFVASYSQATVSAFNATSGALAWSTTAPGSLVSCPASASSPAIVNNVVYVALCPSQTKPTASVFALRADTGAILWSAGGGAMTTSPSVLGGVVYVGSSAGRLEARSTTDGSLRWSATLGGSIVSSPAVTNRVLYVGADDGKLYGFDPNGKTSCAGSPLVCQPLWTATTGGAVRSSAAASN